MICRIQARWSKSKEELTSEIWEAYKKVACLSSGSPIPSYFYSEDLIADLEEAFTTLIPLGFELTVKNFKQNLFVGLDGRLTCDTPSDLPVPITQSVTHVHIPNIGLLEIDEVDVMYDECTNRLQERLDGGWRILAVCPPNGTRRPDYIIGRKKEKK